VIHPDRITRRAASASRSPIQGRAMGINGLTVAVMRSALVIQNATGKMQKTVSKARAPFEF
jgi:hypothetical protein